MKKLIVLVAAFLIVSSSTKADVLIEPAVGFNFSSKIDVSGGKTYSSGLGGAYGGRLGYQKLGFQIGADYLHSSLDMDHKDFKKNVTLNEWAAFVGYEFPILLRVYAGYIFSANGESKNDAGKITYKDGSGVKAGVGFTLFPFLDLNLEYRRGTFSERKEGGVSIEKDVNYSTYMIGLSIPFTI